MQFKRLVGGFGELTNVTPSKIEWLWNDRFPLGKMVMLSGDPGLGKTNVVLDLIKRITTGDEWPDGASNLHGPKGVIYITSEDGIADTVLPRLLSIGADITRVRAVKFLSFQDEEDGPVYQRIFSILEDMELLEEAIEQVDAKLVVFDPIMHFLSSSNTYKETEVRAALQPLDRLAEDKGLTMLLLRHNHKGSSDTAIYKGTGSIAFTAYVRAEFTVLPDVEDETKRVFLPIKANLSRSRKGLVYSLETTADGQAQAVWHGETAKTEKEIRGLAKPSEPRQLIYKLLEESGEAMSAGDIERALPEESQKAVPMTLSRMAREGTLIKAAWGKYTLPTTQDKDERTVLDEAVQMFATKS